MTAKNDTTYVSLRYFTSGYGVLSSFAVSVKGQYEVIVYDPTE